MLAVQAWLDAQQLQALWQQCRAAKEVLLDPDSTVAEQPVTILGRGSSLSVASVMIASVPSLFAWASAVVKRRLRSAFGPMTSIGIVERMTKINRIR